MKKSPDQETLAQRAPKLAELMQQELFDDIWQRSLLTLATLTALGRVQPLPRHINYARITNFARRFRQRWQSIR